MGGTMKKEIEKMGIKTQEILTGEQVLSMLTAAFNDAKTKNFDVTITIVDKSGQKLGVIRSEDAGVHTLSASYKKAYTAAWWVLDPR